jgi:psp operon transcriptional activator
MPTAARPVRQADDVAAEPITAPTARDEPRDGHLTIALDDVCDFRAAVDTHEAAILRRALERNRFNQRATAKALGLSYDQLRHCLRKHGLL